MSYILYKELSDKIIGCAITVHKAEGPDYWNVHMKTVCV